MQVSPIEILWATMLALNALAFFAVVKNRDHLQAQINQLKRRLHDLE